MPENVNIYVRKYAALIMRGVFALFAAAFLFAGCSKAKPAYNLAAIKSPVIFGGNDTVAYRDPAALFFNDTVYLFFTVVRIEGDSIFSYTAQSESGDLADWSEPRIITPRGQALNYSSPGNVVRFNGEWVLCLQTYPRPGYTVDRMPRYADHTARLYMMRSKDLRNWSEPQLIKVKGDIPVGDMGRMIDPYLIEDKDEPGKWWCFYKQNGVSMSYSYDLEHWIFSGYADSGENACVLAGNGEYVLLHSPENGIGVKRSSDLVHWTDDPQLITLGQKQWTWAQGRITAGFAVDLKNVRGIGKYVMFFHGSGPLTEHEGDFDKNSSIGIAWSDDLVRWQWPGRNNIAGN